MIINELEYVPFALLVLIDGILASSDEVEHCGGMITYSFARVMHSYVHAKQRTVAPWVLSPRS